MSDSDWAPPGYTPPTGTTPPVQQPPADEPPGDEAPGDEPPGSAPYGYATPGYAPPGYAPPGYAPPGYVAPGYVAPVPGSGAPRASHLLLVVAVATSFVIALVLGSVAATAIGHRTWPGAGSSAASFRQPTDSGAAAAAKVDPSVAEITTTLGYDNGEAAGTGIVLTSTGEVVTNNHVVSGSTAIKVQINGQGHVYSATVVGTDAVDDVAVIALHGASGLKPVAISSSPASIGQAVVAVGNALGRGGAPAVSSGTVQALDQSITAADPGAGTSERLTGLIEIDARLLPGDSGGPLVNLAGQAVGMDTAASTSGRSRAESSAGYAIPIAKVMAIAKQIESGTTGGNVHIGTTGFLGVRVESPASAGGSTTGSGALVTTVVPGTPAASAGIVAGDLIVGVDNKAIDSPTALTTALQAHHAGDRVVVGWTDTSGKRHSATVTLATGPAG